MFSVASGIFFWTGISLALSAKILDFCSDLIDQTKVKSRLYFETCAVGHNCVAGNWKNSKDYKEELVSQGLYIGELFTTPTYIWFFILILTETGNLNDAKKSLVRLADISSLYDNEFSLLVKYVANTRFLMKCRRINEALIEINESISFAQGRYSVTHQSLLFFSLKARLELIMGNISEAANSLEQANKIRMEVEASPLFSADYFLSKFIYELNKLEEAVEVAKQGELRVQQKRALEVGKALMRITKRESIDLVESYKLMGTYYWLTKKQKPAVRFWAKSLIEAEKLDARLELSRTYFEVGKRLSESGSKIKELNGLNAADYILRAQDSFKEMNLQWDLDEIERMRLFGEFPIINSKNQ